MSKIFIGTSGYSYSGWEDVFYPRDLDRKKQLEYYSQRLKTVEINSSFYHLPSLKTFQSWRKKTPKNFIFALKSSRYITHVKKLKDCKEPWQRFITNARGLKEKLGPILFQLPANFKVNEERLEDFLIFLPKKYRYAFEFRNRTWFKKEIYQILKKHNVALCIADSLKWPLEEKITADFVYLRFHGKVLYSSKYSEKELKQWAEKIKKWRKDVYVYFNNDAFGHAPNDAKRLIEKIKGVSWLTNPDRI